MPYLHNQRQQSNVHVGDNRGVAPVHTWARPYMCICSVTVCKTDKSGNEESVVERKQYDTPTSSLIHAHVGLHVDAGLSFSLHDLGVATVYPFWV